MATTSRATAKDVTRATGAARRSPQATTAYVPSGEAMVLFKAAELGVQASKKLADWLQSEGPLVVQVLDVATQGSKYLVHFRATNQTVHGLYVLGAELSWPTALPELPLYWQHKASMSMGERPPSSNKYTFPIHIASAKSLDFYIEIALPSKAHMDAGLWNRRVGKFKLTFQLLNKESNDSRNVDFSILLPKEGLATR